MHVPSLRALFVVCGLTLFATRTSLADEVDDQTMAEARKYFQAGVNLLDDPDGARYEDAYNAFQRAFAISRSPKVLGNIGFCALKLERDGEAIDAYTTYLRDSRDVDPRERAQIERDLATLNSSVASFKVVFPKNSGAASIIDTRVQTRGAPVVNSYSFTGPEVTLRIRPGRHAFKVKLNDLESRVYDVSIDAGSQSAHEFTLAPPAPVVREVVTAPSRPSYAGPILIGGLGIAALGAGVVTGFLARSATSDIESSCPNDLCPATYDLDGHRREAKTLGTVTDATLITGGVMLAGAIVWALLTPSTKAAKTPRVGTLGALGGTF
jgi:hypothetical protein